MKRRMPAPRMLDGSVPPPAPGTGRRMGAGAAWRWTLRAGRGVGMAAFAGALLAGAGATPAHAETPVRGGTLTVALETDVRGFDTVKGGVYGVSGRTVAGAIEEPLLLLDEKGGLQPHLALAWEPSPDGKEWTVKLRPGVKFHDGRPFTAEAVAAHFNRILDPKNRARARAFITPILGAEALDELTVRFRLKHPWLAFAPTLAGRDMAGLIESPDQVKAGKQNRHPIGTGPFVFKEWRGGDRIIVERNPDYWDAERIHLDRIVYRILPDPQTRYQSIEAGNVDVIWTDRGNSIRKAQKDPRIVVYAEDGAGAAITFLNTSKPPLDNPDVRAALAHAWNQMATIKITWKDTRPFVRHPYTGLHDCPGDVGYREHDFEKAKAYLARYGKPVKLSMIHTTTPRGRELGELLQQLYRRIGVELTLEPVDQNTLVKRVFTNNYMISGWRIADGLDIGPQVFALSHSKSPYNLTHYATPELDKLAVAMRTANDQEMRNKLQCDIARVWNQSGHIQYRGGNRYHVLTRPVVKGVRHFRVGTPYVWYMWKAEG